MPTIQSHARTHALARCDPEMSDTRSRIKTRVRACVPLENYPIKNNVSINPRVCIGRASRPSAHRASSALSPISARIPHLQITQKMCVHVSVCVCV